MSLILSVSLSLVYKKFDKFSTTVQKYAVIPVNITLIVVFIFVHLYIFMKRKQIRMQSTVNSKKASIFLPFIILTTFVIFWFIPNCVISLTSHRMNDEINADSTVFQVKRVLIFCNSIADSVTCIFLSPVILPIIRRKIRR